MDKSGFELHFEKHPWQCLIIRKGEIVFHLLTDYELISESIKANKYKFQFRDQSLLIKVKGSKASFEWLGQKIKNQIHLSGYWYGGGELINQPLTWNETMFPLTEFITYDNGQTGLSTILSPIWLSSLGLSLKVNSPFAIGINQPPGKYLNRQDGFSPDLIPFKDRPFLDLKGEGDGLISLVADDLDFEILIEDNIISCHQALVKEIGVPAKTPPLELMGAPIWTTWARYKERINQDTVLEFAREIQDNGYPYHVLEIDDRWQTRYGDLEFDPDKFPDPKKMVQQLHEMGFKVTVWVVPFFHPQSVAGKEAAQKGYLVQIQNGEPYPVKWWQGRGFLLDVTNQEALDWYKSRLDSFRDKLGLDGYKFDAGEGKYCPKEGIFNKPLVSQNDYTHLYVKWISENFAFCEVRSGWMNQTAPIFFRLWDLWSVWGYDNGLRSIIPSTLAMSLTGYPFVFPDMIGGNAYFTFPRNRVLNWILQKIVMPVMERNVKSKSDFPEEEILSLGDVPTWIEKSTLFGYPTPELMVRWAQANVFLGVMQFSLSPWEFGEQCNQCCRDAAELHLEYLPTLQKFARQALEHGEPIIRPVFWLAPDDEDALICDDQFLVGDEILVAPVLYSKQFSRKIYFPPGTWQDYWSGELFTGPQTIENYPAPLSKLPFFIQKTGQN